MATEPSSNHSASQRRIAIILSTYSLRLLGQGVSFFLFAKALGAENFGFVVAALAVFSPLSPLVDMGAYSIVSRDIALGRAPLQVIGENLTMMLITLPLALVIALLFFHFTNPGLNPLTLGMVGFAYLSISRTSQLLAAVQNTMNQRIPIILVEAVSAILLVSLGLLGLVHNYSLSWWANAYACIGAVVIVVSLFMLRVYVGDFQLNLWPNKNRFKEGLTFSFGNTFQYIYTDIDKVILLKFSTASFVGVFGMASRISSLALIPIGAIYSLFYPRFMRSGHGLDIPIHQLLARVLVFSCVYSCVIVSMLFLLAPLLPKFLGTGYAGTPDLLKILAISVVFQVFQTPFADAITGMGFQLYRTIIQAFSCILSIVGGAILIPSQPKLGVLQLNLALHGSLLILYVITCFLLLKNFQTSPSKSLRSHNV